MSGSIREQLDTLFVVSGEMIENSGEDNFCCLSRGCSSIAAVFDGCGGLGAKTYAGFQGHTGAYVSSRLMSGAIYDWFLDTNYHIWKSGSDLTQSMNGYMKQAFAVSEPYSSNSLMLMGSMVRDFPTTAAIALVQEHNDSLYLFAVWAGDSRVYLLDSKGLAQLSTDDVSGRDAMSNISNEGALTNVISSDGKFVLHHKVIKIEDPSLVLTATDGCFGYLPSPMAFEHMILSSLQNTSSPFEYRKKLDKEIREVAGDDYSLACMSFNFGSFSELKNALSARTAFVYSQFINTGVSVEKLWPEYRKSYERFWG